MDPDFSPEPDDAGMIASRVAAGARWLDERIPNWYRKIDTDILNIKSPYDCVLGQLAYVNCYGSDWRHTLSWFDQPFTHEFVISHGFADESEPATVMYLLRSAAGRFTGTPACQCEELTRAWQAEITGRLLGATPTGVTPWAAPALVV